MSLLVLVLKVKSLSDVNAVRMRVNVCMCLTRNVSVPPCFVVWTLMKLVSSLSHGQIGGMVDDHVAWILVCLASRLAHKILDRSFPFPQNEMDLVRGFSLR